MEENKQVLKLNRPILVNGEMVAEIPYNFDALTARDKLQVVFDMRQAGFAMNTVEEFDPAYHLFLFAKAAEIASGGEITASDLMRISAKDGKSAGELARDFFYL